MKCVILECHNFLDKEQKRINWNIKILPLGYFMRYHPQKVIRISKIVTYIHCNPNIKLNFTIVVSYYCSYYLFSNNLSKKIYHNFKTYNISQLRCYIHKLLHMQFRWIWKLPILPLWQCFKTFLQKNPSLITDAHQEECITDTLWEKETLIIM